jgi:hypothetical protein
VDLEQEGDEAEKMAAGAQHCSHILAAVHGARTCSKT